MAQGTMTALQPIIKTKTVRITDTITLNSDGYENISSYKPTGMNNLLFALLESWGANYPKAGFIVTSTGNYVIGSAGMTISGLVIKYFYTD